MTIETNIDLDFDQQHVWHPYSSMSQPSSVSGVISATGVELTLMDDVKVIDGTSSWWASIHGYSHPDIVKAMKAQLDQLSHVMFGGLTHRPAIELAKKLVSMTSANLSKVFYADSGSIAVEVALKMAMQYWQGRGQSQKQRLLTVKCGYHGDSFAAMSICDPDNGMHTMFGQSVTQQLFAPAPMTPFDAGSCQAHLLQDDLIEMRHLLGQHHKVIAAVIIEPIMQGAGGMRLYSADYLRGLRTLCDEFDVLLILDEIATGFGRTGKLFAYQHADIEPDILCLGKALTGGHISLAATLCSDEVAAGIDESPAGVFMHGPTFMGNPLACTTACANLDILAKNHWQVQVLNIENQLKLQLAEAIDLPSVKDVRVLGAIGILEMHQQVDINQLQKKFIELGVWIRPFANLIYIMPAFIITPEQLLKLTTAMKLVAREIADSSDNQTKHYSISHG